MSAAESRALRDAFGAFQTGVTVVTCARRNDVPVGVTVNSFVSLSLSPPLVSIALHSAAGHLSSFVDTATFAINVLGADQHALSNRFARPSQCTWDDVRYRTLPSGHIVLEGAAAFFLCRLAAQHAVGDHRLLVGRVEHFAHEAGVEPLAFLRGRYGRFLPAAHDAPASFPEQWSAPAIGWG